MSKNFARAIFAVTACFFAAFFLWPIIQILKGGFIDADGKFTLAYLGVLLVDPVYLGGLKNSFFLACATTTLALCIALPLAFISDRFLFPGKAFLGSLILIPMILPPFVGAIGIKQIFGQYGALNSLIIELGLRPEGWTFDWFAANQFWGVAVIQALSLYPIIYLNAVAALANIDPAMEEAAQNLGARPERALWRVTLPLVAPNLLAGGLLAFAFAMLEVSDSLILAQKQIFYPITKAIMELFQLLGDGKYIASALGVWAMVFLGVTIVGMSLLLGKKLGAIFRV